jgi:hypothetical protein
MQIYKTNGKFAKVLLFLELREGKSAAYLAYVSISATSKVQKESIKRFNAPNFRDPMSDS